MRQTTSPPALPAWSIARRRGRDGDILTSRPGRLDEETRLSGPARLISMTAMAGGAGQLLGGRYRLVEPVGTGGMGQVWRGYDEVLKREVAVKEVLLPAGLSGTQRDSMIARTMREARAAARLHHPGIVLVYDAIQREGVPWIVMEFISGPSLAQAIAGHGRLAWERVAVLGRDLAGALAHAHAAGVVHRDLKPANVLLAGHRTVLTDFGVARILDATTQLTSTGTVIGTPHYMPPEQIEGEPVQAPADLWALGATLYHAVEGLPPFDGPTMLAVFAAILTRPLPTPGNAGPLAPVLYSLLTKAPGQRPSAAALTGQLTALLRPDLPVRAVRSPGAASPSDPPTVTGAARQGSPLRPAVLTGHSGRVYSVAFSPDGTHAGQRMRPGSRPGRFARQRRLQSPAMGRGHPNLRRRPHRPPGCCVLRGVQPGRHHAGQRQL